MATEITANNKNEIVLYQPDHAIKLEVLVENETVWLSLNQMTALFNRDKSVISRHIRNIFDEGELSKISVVANFATTAADGKTYIVDYYNLDVIISVGYRVKSVQGTQFRQWANRVLKEYILKGYAINQRFEYVERRLENVEDKINFFVRTSLPPVEGLFYDGQIFDAYVFIANLIKSASKQIILIDNYIDETVLIFLSKRNVGIKATIYTAKISAQLQLDLDKHNAQYPAIFIEEKPNIHDRFLLIDNDIYHIGASLKDLGKKLFGFAKMDIPAEEFLKHIG